MIVSFTVFVIFHFGEIIWENSDVLLGFFPRHLCIPIAITMYYLLSDLGYRNAPVPHGGTHWRKRGDIILPKKRFSTEQLFFISLS